MNNAKVIAIMTCYNRKEKTVACIKKLLKNKSEMEFIVVDDASQDGTSDEIKKITDNLHVLQGTGQLYWNGGMRKGIAYAKSECNPADYYLLCNDDVNFFDYCIDKLVANIQQNEVLIGSTVNKAGKLSYGGIKYLGKKSLKYFVVGAESQDKECDTFNMNCVLIPQKIFYDIENLDKKFQHSMGDFDYGFQIKKTGYINRVFDEYVGICDENSIRGTWQDCTLPRIERIKRKEQEKGLPFREWFYFLNKNFGIVTAIVRSVTPYIKILIGK